MIRFEAIFLSTFIALLLLGGTAYAGGKNKKKDPNAYQEITVSTAEELFEAIGPNRTIFIEVDTINLTSLSGYEMGGSAIESTEFARMSWGLNLMQVKNLTIRRNGPKPAVILDDFKEHITIQFDSCSGISLDNLIIGHMPQEDAFCEKEVIAIRACNDFDIDSVGLFGTGAQGFVAFESQNIYLGNCEIFDCSQGAFTIRNSTVYVEDCHIYDINVYYAGIKVFGQSELGAYGCTFEKLWGADTYLIDAADETYLDFYGCSITNNKGARLINGSGVVIMEECSFDRNRFTEEE